MGRIEKTVFISYRRTNLPWALAIFQNLTAHGYDVFFDYESINSGDFEQVILGNIRARAHFLVVLTPSALERCSDPNDWLRREIETALDEKRNIVPLFLEGFNFGSPSISNQLTGKLERIKSYNGLNIPADYFNEAMERLQSRFLNVSLDAVLHPVSVTVQREVKKQQVAASGATQVKEKELTAQEWYENGIKSTDLDEQIHCYTEAIRLKPDFAEAYNNRGATSYNKGDLDSALQDYTRSIELNDPELHFPYNNRGNARKAKGDLDGAIKDYTEAIRLKPDFAEAYNNRGIVLKDKNDLEGAIKNYTEAIRIRPDYAEAYNNRGIVLKDKNDFDGAIKDYTEAIRIRPNYAIAYNNRGIALKDKNDLDGAIKDYNKAIHLKPNYANAYSNRGIANSQKGDLDGAIKDYNEAIRLNPNFANAYYNRAGAWKQKENHYVAITDYQKYLDLGGGIQNGDQKEVEGFIYDLKEKIK
jgi:tetratricopeptide (TPR) repeat protein